jgi:hypothetical protein
MTGAGLPPCSGRWGQYALLDFIISTLHLTILHAFQANKSHYLHRFLHGNMALHISVVSSDHMDRIYKYYR